MPNIIGSCNRMTKDRAAKELGLKTYDTALPQQWLDNATEKLSSLSVNDKGELYDILLSSIVWSYDNSKIFGQPAPLTFTAWAWLRRLDGLVGTNYVDETKALINVLAI